MSLKIGGEGAGRFVTAATVFLEALHDDPVQVAPQPCAQIREVVPAVARHGGLLFGGHGAQAGGGARWLLFRDDALHGPVTSLEQFPRGKRRGTGQQFVQQNPQRVDVGPRVDIQLAHLGLLRAHVSRGTDHLGEVGEQRLLGKPLISGLGD
jgi:hypothetical protein